MKKIICFVFTALMCALCFVPYMKNAKAGTSASVQKNVSDVVDYLKKKYSASDVKNIKITAGKEKKLNSNNYNQSKIKEYYNNHNGSKPDLGSSGICWCSTAVSILKFNDVSTDKNTLGYNLISYAYDKKKLLGGGYSNKKELEDFAIVNDTWADSSEHQYSYFPVNELGTNIISRWDFGLVKILNK